MKVLHVIDTLAVGGSEQSLLAILSHFQSYQPVMCHIYPGDTLKADYERAGIPVISLGIDHRYAFQRAIPALYKVINQEKPDIVHTTLFRADVVGRTAGRLAKKPVVSSFVNEAYHSTRKESISRLGQTKLGVIQQMDRFTSAWTDHFVAVSEATKSANCQALGIAEERVTVIYRGRDPKPFLSVTAEDIGATRKALGISTEGPILLNVARILARKGQEELVRAMTRVLQSFPTATLLIAGEGHDRPHLEAVIKELGLENSVHLLGSRHDIPVLLQMADLFVFPSHYEGHPGALVEAMLAGRPILASDIPVHRETLPAAAGRLTPVADASLLGNAIVEMLRDPHQRAQSGDVARQVALERFDICQVASQHEDLYARIARQ